jgi:carbon-monoxide dehydrogenase large subunit
VAVPPRKPPNRKTPRRDGIIEQEKLPEDTAMTATGIGAAVRRKEDHRFITGKGHYTDDINRPGQAYAYFVRSPHAHATIKSIDAKDAASACPACSRVLTGAELAADKIGNLICGWMIHSKDGSPMKMAPHPALANGKVCHVGDQVAVVVAETLAQARDAAEKVKVDYAVLPAVADPAAAQRQGAPQIHDVAPNNTIYQWHLGDPKAVDAAFKAAKHVTKLDIVNNRLVPNAMEPRAAIAEYDAGTDAFTLWNTTQNPHVARLVIAAFIGMAPEHKLRVIAPDVGGGFGSKIFIYPEEVVALWAAKRVGRPVKWVRPLEAFLTDAHGRDHVTHAEMASTPTARFSAFAPRPSPISAPTCRSSRHRCRPISTPRCCRASTRFRRSIARSMRSTPTRCRSTPIAAPGAPKRPSWSSA